MRPHHNPTKPTPMSWAEFAAHGVLMFALGFFGLMAFASTLPVAV